MIRAILVVSAVLCCISPARSDVPIPVNYQISSPSDEMQNEEQIVVNPLDSLNVIVAHRDRRVHDSLTVAIGVSTDGGGTWSDSVLPLSLRPLGKQSDPALTVDGSGTVYFAYLDFDTDPETGNFGDSSHILMIRSTDGGESWLGPTAVPSPAGPYLEDKEFITVDNTGGIHNGNLYLAWARTDIDDSYARGRRIMFSRSTDGGISFGDTLVIGPAFLYEWSGGTDSSGAGIGAQPLVGSDGSVYVFWVGYNYDYDGNRFDSLTMVKSTDGGITFTPPAAIRATTEREYLDGNVLAWGFPTSAADISGGPYDGYLYVMYANRTNYDTVMDWNVYCVRSTDGGQTWSEPYVVNDDNNNGPNPPYDQFHPWLYCNQDGVLVCVFYDQRTDPDNHFYFDVFAAYSFDGGETFTTNHRLSDVSINPDVLKQKSPGATDGSRPERIAEYIGVTAFKDHVNATWSDSRNGNWDVFGADYVIPLLRPRLTPIPDNKGLTLGDTLSWSTCWHEDDVSYRIEIDDDPFFGSINVTRTIGVNAYTIDAVGLNGEYSYRIKAFRPSDGDSSDYSLTGTAFIDTDSPGIVALLDPENGAKRCRPIIIFDWTPITIDEGDHFDVEIALDSTFVPGTGYHHYTNILTPPFVLPDSLDPVGTYFWGVSQTDSLGNCAGYTSAFSFDLDALPCGDADNDCAVNIGDAVYIINYIFKGGPPPEPLCSGDANGDGAVNIGDAVYLINYIFKGGPAPVEDCCG